MTKGSDFKDKTMEEEDKVFYDYRGGLPTPRPSCGIKQIYDGTFSRKKIPGHGLFAELCIKARYKVLDLELMICTVGLYNARKALKMCKNQ